MLLQQLPRLENRACLLRPDARARPGCRDEGVAGLDLVAFRRSLAHHLDGADNLAQLQKARLRLFERGLGDLRSVVGFCQRADLVGGAVDLLAERHLAALEDRRDPMGQRFDFCFKPGPAQLPEQSLEALADDVVGQDLICRDRQLRVLLGQSKKLDGLVGVCGVVSHVWSPVFGYRATT